MQSRLFALCLLLTLPLAGATGSPRRVAAQTTPAPASTTTTLTLAGLRAPVTIRRDGRGIPHIEAGNDADLYFAQGYVTATDRLWQMDLLRRQARGELAEIFGQAVLEADKRHRAYGFAALAETLAANSSPQARAVLAAYARGVNAYIESCAGQAGHTLPPEFLLLQYQPQPWRPADSIIVGKIFAETLSTTWQSDLMRALLTDLPADVRAALLIEETPLDVLVVGSDAPAGRTGPQSTQPGRPTLQAAGANVVPQAAAARLALFRTLAQDMAATRAALASVGLALPERNASNNWVVAGRRTASGKPLLANDPHLPASAPSIWYMTHLQAPGINVAGVTAPGGPGIIIGHNEQIAWGMTNLGPDVQDLYREQFAADGQTYRTPQGPRPVVVRHEAIKVRKGFASTATDTVMLDVPMTRHGPIILDQDGARYALRWTALDPQTLEFDALYKLNRARNWAEFRAALRDYTGPVQNFVYADAAGHIGYYGAGRIPLRKSGDGSLPYDGTTDAGEWTGYIPFDALPHVYDPPSGLIVTANQRVVGHSYAYFLTHEWAAPYRARRIFDLLMAKQKLTAADFRAVQGDTYTVGGVAFARAVVRQAMPQARATDDRQWQAALQLLADWDGMVNADSRVAPLVAELRTALRQRMLTKLLGATRAREFNWSNGAYVEQLLTLQRADWLPREFQSYAQLLRACYGDANAALTKALGPDTSRWTWGRYAQVRFPHPLAVVPFVGQPFVIPPFAQNGSGAAAGATVNVGANVSMRFIADPADWDQTQQGITLGQSGVPTSPHWTDQLADWRAVTPQVFPFSRTAVAAATQETLTLTPAR